MVLNSQLKLVWSPGAAYIHGLTGNVMVPLSSLCCFLSCHFCLLALCIACLLSLFINVCTSFCVLAELHIPANHDTSVPNSSSKPLHRGVARWNPGSGPFFLSVFFFFYISVWKTYLYLMYVDSCGENPSMRLVSKVGLERGYLGRNIQGDSWVLGNWNSHCKGLQD